MPRRDILTWQLRAYPGCQGLRQLSQGSGVPTRAAAASAHRLRRGSTPQDTAALTARPQGGPGTSLPCIPSWMTDTVCGLGKTPHPNDTLEPAASEPVVQPQCGAACPSSSARTEAGPGRHKTPKGKGDRNTSSRSPCRGPSRRAEVTVPFRRARAPHTREGSTVRSRQQSPWD